MRALIAGLRGLVFIGADQIIRFATFVRHLLVAIFVFDLVTLLFATAREDLRRLAIFELLRVVVLEATVFLVGFFLVACAVFFGETECLRAAEDAAPGNANMSARIIEQTICHFDAIKNTSNFLHCNARTRAVRVLLGWIGEHSAFYRRERNQC
jgi:hypothetical protein